MKRTVMSASKEVVAMLVGKKFMIDIEFYNQKVFDKAVEYGFDKELWEKKNQPNKVIINELKELINNG